MGQPIVCHSDDPNTAGVLGEGPTGVYGSNTLGAGNGIIGYSDAGRGVWGHSNQTGIGVLGEGNQAVGVMGNSQKNAGVLGQGATGVYGHNTVGIGNGIIGYSDAGRGVWGHSNQTGIGVLGEGNQAVGVMGNSQKNAGVLGQGATGVYGHNTVGIGNGIIGYSDAGRGVWGHSNQAGIGVLGESATGIGVQGKGGHLAGFFDGDVEVTGDMRFLNADCAEEFDVADGLLIEPGTVMVLDCNGALAASQRAYDKRVAGVVSGGGDYKPGIVLDKRDTGVLRQPIALLGKVFCKVDAQFGAIAVGDLLTTSPTPGHAMMTSDPHKSFGAVIGKALRALEGGQGVIPVLVALQ